MIRGNFNALRNLSTALKALPAKLRLEAGKALGQEAMKQIADGFREERDPYERPWEPLKKRRGRILRDTGRLRNSFFVRPMLLGFAVTSNVRYARFHQQGTRRMPRRMMMPSGRLGPIWTDALNRVANKLMKRWVNGGQ